MVILCGKDVLNRDKLPNFISQTLFNSLNCRDWVCPRGGLMGVLPCNIPGKYCLLHDMHSKIDLGRAFCDLLTLFVALPFMFADCFLY